MARLADDEILTRDVLEWRGLHVFHYAMSSCSQKLRIYLALKGLDWTPHPIDLSAHESYGAWFLGINPRGMVPAAVIDGAVHIESNDIMETLERQSPKPVLWPEQRAAEIRQALEAEDALHHDLRSLSFRFVHGRVGTTKTPELLAAYRDHGGDGAKPDEAKASEVAFYETLAAEGLNDTRCREAAWRFHAAFDAFEKSLASSPYLMGDAVTVVDIAWFVYAHRLDLAGYPFDRLHPRLAAWYRGLTSDSRWSREVDPGPVVSERIAKTRAEHEKTGATLSAVAGF
ncbi:MAG: glutathione S-transferase family protein [Alphaproteobacteria bacterium]|jgi:glutathione S-transferase|nr:glutathione S-transferase family protein [Alphaproteobacteria bacterium]